MRYIVKNQSGLQDLLRAVGGDVNEVIVLSMPDNPSPALLALLSLLSDGGKLEKIEEHQICNECGRQYPVMYMTNGKCKPCAMKIAKAEKSAARNLPAAVAEATTVDEALALEAPVGATERKIERSVSASATIASAYQKRDGTVIGRKVG